MNRTKSDLAHGDAIIHFNRIFRLAWCGIGENAVAVLTLNADGTYSVHCVVRSNTAVNAALTGYFSANKEVMKGLQEQQKAQYAESEKTQAINNAVIGVCEFLDLPFPKVGDEISLDDACVVIETGLGLFQVNLMPQFTKTNPRDMC